MPYIAVYWHSPRRRRQRKLIAEMRAHTHTHMSDMNENKAKKPLGRVCVCDKFQFDAYLRMEKFPFPVLQSEL